MLVLSRKNGESIVIGGKITVKLLRIKGNTAQLGVDAPKELPVHRSEIYQRIRENNGARVAPETLDQRGRS